MGLEEGKENDVRLQKDSKSSKKDNCMKVAEAPNLDAVRDAGEARVTYRLCDKEDESLRVQRSEKGPPKEDGI